MVNLVEASVRELLQINQQIYQNLPFWNQGQGGNVSLKLPTGLMLIKPTGFRLDQLKRSDDLARVNHFDFLERLKNLQLQNFEEIEKEARYNDLIVEAKKQQNSVHRASMEIGFHVALPRKFVLHFHHLNSVLFSEGLGSGFGDLKSESLEAFKKRWGSYFQWVDYQRPGWLLTETFLRSTPTAPLIILRHHGVILQIDQVEEFEEFLKFDCELKELLNQELSLNLSSLQKQIRHQITSCKAEFLCLYPDVAIVESKLKPYLKPEYEVGQNPKWRLLNSEATPPDLLENWQAMVYLQKANPQIGSLSHEQAEALKNLPTELARQKQMNQSKNGK